MKSIHLSILALSVFSSMAFAQSADMIRYGQTINSDIGTLGESDYYSFSADAGDRFLIPIISLGGVDPLVVLYTSDGTEIARTNAPGLGWNSKLKANVSQNYRIEVRDRSNRTGPYALSLFCLNKANTADEGRTQIIPGRATPVSIEPGDFDIFEFKGSIGESFIAIALRTGTSYGPMFGIYGPDGELVQERPAYSDIRFGWAYEPGLGGVNRGIRIRQQGTYRIIYGIRGGANVPHQAGLTLFKHPWPNESDSDGGELVPTVTRSGDLAVGDVDSYFFFATAGDVVNLRMPTAASSYPALWILGPDGTEVADKTGTVQASVENLRLPSTGLYLVVCYSSQARTGIYSITLSGTVHAPQSMSAYCSYLGDTHQVFWLDRAGWNLERADSAGPGSWLPESTPIQTTGGFKTVNLPTSSTAQFYRLVHP